MGLVLGVYQTCRATANGIIGMYGGTEPFYRLYLPMVRPRGSGVGSRGGRTEVDPSRSPTPSPARPPKQVVMGLAGWVSSLFLLDEGVLWLLVLGGVGLSEVIVCLQSGPVLTRTPRSLRTVRVPASCVLYDQRHRAACPRGALLYVRGKRTSLGRAVRTAYRGTTGLVLFTSPTRTGHRGQLLRSRSQPTSASST